MHQDDILYKRNLFVFYTIIAVNFIYFTMILLGLFENLYQYYIAFTAISTLLIAVAFSLKLSPRIIQIVLITSWNISAFLLVFESKHLLAFFWFVCILVITSIYNSPIISLLLISVMSTQTVIILKYNHNLLLHESDRDGYTTLFFIGMILLLCSLQVYFIRKLWHNQERSTLHREFELSSKNGYLRFFFQNADDAIAVFDLNHNTIDVNPAFEKLYGWTREEAIGRSLPLVPPQYIDDANARYERLLKGESIHVNTYDMRKDGTLIDVQVTLSPIYNQYGEMIASSVISRDVSYQKENERLVMQSEKLKVVGEIAAGLAHEIRNPMTVISGFVQMMNADENFPYKSYTELIESEVARINLIISEFLVLSKPQKEQFTTFAICDVIRETIELYSLQIQQKHIDVQFISNNLHPSIEGSYNQIKQVFINLLKNAVEAIDDSGNIRVELCIEDDFVYISIKDTGAGIPAHIIDRIFEPFFTTKMNGTGLGMVITNKIIQEHHGTIKIRSKEKIGTEILIKLPYVEKDSTYQSNKYEKN